MPKLITVANRPYVMQTGSGMDFPLTSDSVRHLVATYPVAKVKPNRLTLKGANGAEVVIRPATRGGGPSFAEESDESE